MFHQRFDSALKLNDVREKFSRIISFYSLQFLVEQLPLPLRKMMKWKMSSITPNIVKNTVIRSGFRLISGMFDFERNEENLFV